jgi:hypothetical protein
VRHRALPIWTAVFLICASRRAWADEKACGAAGEPWVKVVFSAGPAREALQRAMLTDLRAGLEPNQIGVCQAGAPSQSEPVAILNCSFSADGLEVSLEVVDRVTEKRVERDIKLGALPADGRSLALAVESEELLRASWAELGLDAAPRAEKPSPAELRAVVEPRRAPLVSGARGVAVGVRVAIAHYGGEQTQYGGDAFSLLPLPWRLSLELALGLRAALSTTSAHGTISASAVSADLGLSLPWVSRRNFELNAELSSHFSWIDYRARATGAVAASQARGLASVGRLGLGLVFGASRGVRSFTTLGAGYPWLSFGAGDSGHTVTAPSSYEIYATSGLGVVF